MAYKTFKVAGAENNVTINTKMVVAIYNVSSNVTNVVLVGQHQVDVECDHDTVEEFLREGDREDQNV